MIPREKELLRRIKSGDEKAFEQLFKSYYAMLCVYAYELVRSHDLAEEVVQETLIRIWENRNRLTIRSSIKSYLYQSVHNHCINTLKHLQVVKNKSYRYTEDVKRTAETNNPPYDGQAPPSTLFYDGIENDLKGAIQTLPEQCQRIFLMSRFEKRSHQEIANALNISVNTVKTQIRRALEKLKHILEKKIQPQNQFTDESLVHFEKIK